MAAIIIDEGNPRLAFQNDDFAPSAHRIGDFVHGYQDRITIQYSVSNNGDEAGEVTIRLAEVGGEGLGVIKEQSFRVIPMGGLLISTVVFELVWDVTFSEPGDHQMFVQLEDTSEGGKGKLDEHQFTFTITPPEPEPTGPDLFLISGPRIT
jgi:hypothetical protein